MPEQTYPPYAISSQTVPKQLDRWLDLNPQNGPLQRTRGFLKFSAFSIAANYNGYDTIIGEYLYSSPSKFSLQLNLSTLPLYPNYTLCVSWISGGKVYRYRLFKGLYEDLQAQVSYSNYLSGVPNYNGEMIEKHFKLEIWSGAVTTCVQTTDLTLWTSVLGTQDYRYGTDFLLTSPNPLCTGEGWPINPNTNKFDLPFQFGACTYTYGTTNSTVVLGNQIQQVISNENGNLIRI